MQSLLTRGEERGSALSAESDNHRRCALVIVADGFEEMEELVIIGLLREAGVCVKSVALTSGMIGSTHGVWIRPDLTLTDLDGFLSATPISAVILPAGGQSLSRLENDPRVHRLLRRVVAQQGLVATGPVGIRIVRAAEAWSCEPEGETLVRHPGQPLEEFAQELIQRLK